MCTFPRRQTYLLRIKWHLFVKKPSWLFYDGAYLTDWSSTLEWSGLNWTASFSSPIVGTIVTWKNTFMLSNQYFATFCEPSLVIWAPKLLCSELGTQTNWTQIEKLTIYLSRWVHHWSHVVIKWKDLGEKKL